MEIVAIAQRAETVGALEEFVANAGTPFGSERPDVGNFLQMKFLRIVAANDHGKSVFKAQGLGNFKTEALRVEPPDAAVDGVRVVILCHTLAVRIWGFVENGGFRGDPGFYRQSELNRRAGCVGWRGERAGT